ncbi:MULTISPECIES: hypothetical protein [Kitasatospora]|nr:MULTISPECIES: hypothetical protein [Kitasatospora]
MAGGGGRGAVAAAEAVLADPALTPALRRNLADSADDLRRTRAVRVAFGG